MSVHVISWVLEHSEAVLRDRLVLIVLADHASGDGTNAYPSVRTIAKEARLSERAVQYALRSLERDGRIRRSDGRSDWGTTVYSVLMEGGARYAPGGVHETAPTGGAQHAPKPSFTARTDKPSSEPSFSGGARSRIEGEVFDDELEALLGSGS